MKRIKEVLSLLMVILLISTLLYAYLFLGTPTAFSSLPVWVLIALVFLALLPFYRSQYRNQAAGSPRFGLPRLNGRGMSQDDHGYQETRQIALGKSQMTPMLAEFSDWIKEAQYLELLNFQFVKLENSKTNRYRLTLIIANAREYQQMLPRIFGPAEDDSKLIIAEFQRLAKKYQFATEEQLANIFLTYHDFSDDAMTKKQRKPAR